MTSTVQMNHLAVFCMMEKPLQLEPSSAYEPFIAHINWNPRNALVVYVTYVMTTCC